MASSGQKTFAKLEYSEKTVVEALSTINEATWFLLERINLLKDSWKHYVNYNDQIFWIKSCYYKLFLFNQLHLSGSKKNFGDVIQPLSKIPIVEINLDLVHNEKEHFKSNIYANLYQ